MGQEHERQIHAAGNGRIKDNQLLNLFFTPTKLHKKNYQRLRIAFPPLQHNLPSYQKIH
jgi:hypothetical protein